jgi:hypothetical protein
VHKECGHSYHVLKYNPPKSIPADATPAVENMINSNSHAGKPELRRIIYEGLQNHLLQYVAPYYESFSYKKDGP